MYRLFRNLALALLSLSASNLSFGQQTTEQENAAILAMRLATPIAGTSTTWRESLKIAYISTYGDIDDVPKNWEALIRRALVCDANELAKCVESSISALDEIGGIANLQLGNLLEVRKFGMNLGLLMDELTTARVKLTDRLQPPSHPQSLAVSSIGDIKKSAGPWLDTSWYWWIATGVAFVIFAWINSRIIRKLKRKAENPANDSKQSVSDDSTGSQTVATTTEDPLANSAREIADALHQAETDAESFITLITTSGIEGSHLDIVKFWRAAVRAGKQSAMNELEQRGLVVQLKALSSTDDITLLLGRLLDHAALYSSILHTQKKQDSAIFHWSRQIPTALINLHWSFKTRKYMGELRNKTIFSFEVSRAPITMRDTQAKPDDFFQRAARAAITTR